MLLRYSEPNIKGSGCWTRGTGAEATTQVSSGGAISITTVGVTQSAPYLQHPLAGDMNFDLNANRYSTLYKDSIQTVQPAGLYGLYLVRAYQA